VVEVGVVSKWFWFWWCAM